MYTITLENNRDYLTLVWLAEHGYDADFLNLAALSDENEMTGRRIYTMTEPDAWQFNENVNNDTDAFLSCCDSWALQNALCEFWQKIV